MHTRFNDCKYASNVFNTRNKALRNFLYAEHRILSCQSWLEHVHCFAGARPFPVPNNVDFQGRGLAGHRDHQPSAADPVSLRLPHNV